MAVGVEVRHLESSDASGSTSGPTSGSGTRATVAVAGLLAIAVLVVELISRPAPFPSDQTNYLDAARTFPSPPANDAITHQYMRIGLVLPLWLTTKLFGYSETAYYAVPTIAGVLLALGVFALGTLLFSRVVGLAGAVLIVANSLVLPETGEPLPDLLATTLFCWAVVLAVAVRQRRAIVSSSRRQIVVLLAIGALLGWSYLAREYIVFVWPLVPILLARPVGWRGLLWVAMPLAAVGLVESALNFHIYGDPLARLHVAAHHGDGEVPPDIAATYQDKSRRWYLTRLTSGLGSVPEGLWLQAALGATVVGGLLRPRKLGLLLLWSALLYVPMVLLGGLLDPGQPMLRLFKIRYWFPAFPAFLLGGVAAAWLLARWLAGRLPALRSRVELVAAVAVLALVAVPIATAQAAGTGDRTHPAYGDSQLDGFRTWLERNGDGVQEIWTDSRSVRVLPIYTTGVMGGRIWSGQLSTLTRTGPRPEAGDYVVVYSADGRKCGFCAQAAQRALGNPISIPPSWKEVFTTDDRELLIYRVGDGSDLAATGGG